MSYPQEWIGSEDLLEGIAVFMVNGKAYRFALEQFSDMENIGEMLDIAFAMGRDSAKSVLLAGVEGAIEKFKRDFN